MGESMKRSIVLCLLVAAELLGATVARADELSRQVLTNIERSLAALGAYGVKFSAVSGDFRSEGEYAVSGDDLYMRMEGVEVYTEGGVRRQVFRDRREIAVDALDTAAGDFISNPAQGLVALLDAFDAVCVPCDGGGYMLTLSAKGGAAAGAPCDTIIVYTDPAAKYPARICYAGGGASMEIRLDRPVALDGGIPRYSAEKYADFEVIDYR